MKIKILGSGSGILTLGKNHACVWINFSDKNIILDCGEGTAQQLLKNGLDKAALDAIAISHYHPDHITGIFMVLQLLYLQNRTKPLNIYLPEDIDFFVKTLNYFYTFPKKCIFKINFALTSEITKDIPEIQAIPSNHMLGYKDFVRKNNFSNKLISYSFLIRYNAKQVLYSSDLWSTKSIEKYYPKTDLLIIDALHPEPDEILEIPDKTEARIILNHGLSEKLEKLISDERFEIANEKNEITL